MRTKFISGPKKKSIPSNTSKMLQEAISHHQQGRLEQAKQIYEQLLKADGGNADAWHLLGVIAHQGGAHEKAVELISRAIEINPNVADYYYNLGMAFHELNKFHTAIINYNIAKKINPKFLSAYINSGNSLLAIKDFNQALINYNNALEIDKNNTDLYYNRGYLLSLIQNWKEGLNSLYNCIRIDPNFFKAYVCIGNIFTQMKNYEEALRNYNLAIGLNPNYCEAYANLGSLYLEVKKFSLAIENYSKAYLIKSDFIYIQGSLLDAKNSLCDWSRHNEELSILLDKIKANQKVAIPFGLLSMTGSLSLLRQASEIYCQDKHPASEHSKWSGQKYVHQKIRLAYLSCDFKLHPATLNNIQTWEGLDRNRFEVIAISYGVVHKEDASAEGQMRSRLVKAFDKFLDVGDQSDEQVAQLMREMEIDIVVDLSGLTGGGRQGILSHRAAPVQVNFYGFTSGAPYIDYIMADRVTIPPEHQYGYTEKVVYLPDTWLGVDTSRQVSSRQFTREELGLPQQGMVYCSFNNAYKINPQMFDVWMRILLQVPGSVLWLQGGGQEEVQENLRREAQARGVEPNRLVFASKLASIEEHLARHRVADVFLDTLPFNAHTTAADALWAGLPVLTCLGESSFGRVAGSLLLALGMPELVTKDVAEYEALAVRLGRDVSLVAGLKEKIGVQRISAPLFDVGRFTRHLEQAYVQMHERAQQGLGNEGFEVLGVRSVNASKMLQEAISHHQQGRLEQAKQIYEQLLKADSGNADAWHLLGVIAHQGGAHEKAVELISRAIEINPNHCGYYYNLALSMESLKYFDKAIYFYEKSINLNSKYIKAYLNKGICLFSLRKNKEAIECFESALKLDAHYVPALTNLGVVLQESGKLDQAINSLNFAIAFDNRCTEAYSNLGNIFYEIKNYNSAIFNYFSALKINSNYPYLIGRLLNTKLYICDWSRHNEELSILLDKIKANQKVAIPFGLLSMTGSLSLLRQASEIYCQDKHPASEHSKWSGQKYVHQKIRLAYLSCDFKLHPATRNNIQTWEGLDRNRFEVIAISYGVVHKEDASAEGQMRSRLVKAFDKFLDVGDQSDEQVAQLMREMEIDIVVDLSGLTGGGRQGILSHRAAPVQVNFYGFTSGAPYIDYIMADRVTIPPEHQYGYTEKVVYLPDTWLGVDTSRQVSSRQFTREELGLPQQGMVYCSFNNAYKINPQMFDVWMRILLQVPGSVLWLQGGGQEEVQENLRREAQARGVEPNRLVFASKLASIEEHLARHRVADVFLDTLPFNAHTTAADALWAGLPVLTCLGESSFGRVAGSLLLALGMPELVTKDVAEYEALAVRLGRDVSLVAGLKEKIGVQRISAPLFDVGRFTRHLEQAYVQMHERAQQGLGNEGFEVLGVRSVNASKMLQEAISHHQQGRLEQAKQIYEQLLKADSGNADAWHLLGVIAHQGGAHEKAVELISRAIEINPNVADYYNNRANAYKYLNNKNSAIQDYNNSLKINEKFIEAKFNLGLLYKSMDLNISKKCFSEVIKIDAKSVESYCEICEILILQKNYKIAYLFINKGLKDNTNNHKLIIIEGRILQELKQYRSAIISYQNAFNLRPEYAYLIGRLLHVKMYICDWNFHNEELSILLDKIGANCRSITPFALLSMTGSLSLLRQASEIYCQDKHPASEHSKWSGQKYVHQKIRLAYLSCDFKLHPATLNNIQTWEGLDRNRFEVIAISYGVVHKEDASAEGQMRSRLVKAFDKFLDVGDQSDEQVAQLMREMEIDIVVDLSGTMRDSRQGILSHRAAPVQVNFYGFTSGAPYIDYIMADRVTIPPEHQYGYTEKVVYLPDTWLGVDTSRQVSSRQFTREELGLPQQGMVYCSFNNAYKINPQMFDVWMRILLQVPGSVLWLQGGGQEEVQENLRREAQARGVEPNRLVFASKLASIEEHLARHRVADVFLDTLPFNAHTTAADALWAGLPVLTCLGESSFGRVAGSLLLALGMPELVTKDVAEYEALAVRLGRDVSLVAGLKEKIGVQRISAPLFDVGRFTRHLEQAYVQMHESVDYPPNELRNEFGVKQ